MAQAYDILIKLIPLIAGIILLISVIAAYVCSSAQLSQALESLQSANEQLLSDIEKERRQERQRIEFF